MFILLAAKGCLGFVTFLAATAILHSPSGGQIILLPRAAARFYSLCRVFKTGFFVSTAEKCGCFE